MVGSYGGILSVYDGLLWRGIECLWWAPMVEF